MEGTAASGGGVRPKVVVFDLDGCVWYPEMYMMWGGGAPFTVQPNGDLKDRSGSKCYLMGAVRDIMHSPKTDSGWGETQVAVASSCDEPSWARECLTKFLVGEGIPLSDIVSPNLIEIYKASSKQVHLKAISKASGVPLSEMMFLDKCVTLPAHAIDLPPHPLL